MKTHSLRLAAVLALSSSLITPALAGPLRICSEELTVFTSTEEAVKSVYAQIDRVLKSQEGEVKLEIGPITINKTRASSYYTACATARMVDGSAD